MQVRSVIPFIGQGGGNWNFSAKENLEPIGDVAEVWETNDDFFAHTQGFFYDKIRFLDLLNVWFRIT